MNTFVSIFCLFQYAQMHFLIAHLVIISTDVTYARKDLKLTVTTHAPLQVLHVSQSMGGGNHYRIIEITQLWTCLVLCTMIFDDLLVYPCVTWGLNIRLLKYKKYIQLDMMDMYM